MVLKTKSIKSSESPNQVNVSHTINRKRIINLTNNYRVDAKN